MKALILAAGVSRRLYPITENIPKCLLEVGGRTILHRQLQSLKDLKIKDVTIVVGYYRELVADYIDQYFPDLNIQFVINHHFFETNTAYSVYLCRDIIREHHHILMNGDVLYPKALLKTVLDDQHDNVLAVEIKKCGAEEVKVIAGADQRIVAIGKKMMPENCLGEFIGVAKLSRTFNQSFAKSLKNLISAGGKEDYFEAAMDKILNHHHVFYNDVTNYPCVEIDFIEDLEKARKLAKKDKDL